MPCRGLGIFRRLCWTSPRRRPRTTRSGPKAWVRPAPMAARRHSQTPCSTRSRRLESRSWTCHSPPPGCGRPSSAPDKPDRRLPPRARKERLRAGPSQWPRSQAPPRFGLDNGGMRTKTILVLALLLGAVLLPGHALAQDARNFPDTGYTIEDDAIWAFFQAHGGADTFGAPISREMAMQGLQLQIFQNAALQIQTDGSVQPAQLTSAGWLPYTSFGGLTVPKADA